MTDKQFRPMLAPNDQTIIENIKWPKFGTYKLDGIRAMVVNGVLVSRKLKPIPNRYVQSLYGRPEFEGLDGELIVGDPYGLDVMTRSTKVMARDGQPDVHWHVFDYIAEDLAYVARRKIASERCYGAKMSLLYQYELNNVDQMMKLEEEAVEIGYEGIMLRCPLSAYKFGRATQRENTLLKIKRWDYRECKVLGFVEGTRNDNELQKDELGLAKRQTLKENMVPNGTLGSFIVEYEDGVVAGVGTGNLTAEECQYIWNNQSEFLGRVMTRKAMPPVKDAWRFPGHHAWRHEDDIGDPDADANS